MDVLSVCLCGAGAMVGMDLHGWVLLYVCVCWCMYVCAGVFVCVCAGAMVCMDLHGWVLLYVCVCWCMYVCAGVVFLCCVQ